MLVTGTTGSFVGYGKTNDFATRISTHRLKLSEHGFAIEKMFTMFGDGQVIQQVESQINQMFEKPDFRVDVTGFKREATLSCNYERLIEFALSFEHHHSETQQVPLQDKMMGYFFQHNLDKQ